MDYRRRTRGRNNTRGSRPRYAESSDSRSGSNSSSFSISSDQEFELRQAEQENDRYFKRGKNSETRPPFLSGTYERVLKKQGMRSKNRSVSKDSLTGRPAYQGKFRVTNPVGMEDYILDKAKKMPMLRTRNDKRAARQVWKPQHLELDHYPTQYTFIKQAYEEELGLQRALLNRQHRSPSLAAAFKGAVSDKDNLRALEHGDHKAKGKKATRASDNRTQQIHGKSLYREHLQRLKSNSAMRSESTEQMIKTRDNLAQGKRPKWMLK